MSDEKRTKTLALSSFIESQRTLLSRTHSDIERLRDLRGNLSRASELTPDLLSQQLDQGVFRLSSQNDLAFNILREIDWSLYKSQDPSPFHALASELKRSRLERTQPSNIQRSELSDLQKLVKQTRRSIVDPVLARLASDPQWIISSDEDEPIDPDEIRKELEREKIRELKKRKITCALTIPVHGGGGSATTRVPRTTGIFIRRDQDESADVDITFDEEVLRAAEVDQIPFSAPAPDPSPVSITVPPPASDRPNARRSRKATHRAVPTNPKKETKRKPPIEDESLSIPKRIRGPKSDTYKLAWSVEEQRLLEQLLEEIPDGEKNRWAKISQAMNGRRTARQVASRVQKYFEKLRKFGVDVDEINTEQINNILP